MAKRSEEIPLTLIPEVGRWVIIELAKEGVRRGEGDIEFGLWIWQLSHGLVSHWDANRSSFVVLVHAARERAASGVLSLDEIADLMGYELNACVPSPSTSNLVSQCSRGEQIDLRSGNVTIEEVLRWWIVYVGFMVHEFEAHVTDDFVQILESEFGAEKARQAAEPFGKSLRDAIYRFGEEPTEIGLNVCRDATFGSIALTANATDPDFDQYLQHLRPCERPHDTSVEKKPL